MFKFFLSHEGLDSYEVIPLKKNKYHQPYVVEGTEERSVLLNGINIKGVELKNIMSFAGEMSGKFVLLNLKLFFKEWSIYHLKNTEIKTCFLALSYIVRRLCITIY